MVHSRPHISHITFARVVKLADTPDLGSGAVRREGSSPSPSILKIVSFDTVFFVFGIIDLYKGLDSTGGLDCSASGLLLCAPLLDMSSKTPLIVVASLIGIITSTNLCSCMHQRLR